MRYLCSLFSIVSFLLGSAAAQDEVRKTWFLDASGGEPRANAKVELEAVGKNPQDPNSLVLPAPGRSRVRMALELPAVPKEAWLSITHLSSGAKVPLGGTSKVAIRINGHAFLAGWEVGSHTFHEDRLAITKMLRAGPNKFELAFEAGQTAYWLRRLAIECTFAKEAKLDAKVEHLRGKGAYAAVVSRATWEDAQWRPVVEALREKHSASVIIWPAHVRQARAALAAEHPRHACFVARPGELGRDFVVQVHRMTRTLDEDPYTDVLWGILTGYEAADALRIARCTEPLRVRRALAGCGIDLGVFREGAWYSESQKNLLWQKRPGEAAKKLEGPDDTTSALVEGLNAGRADIFLTSGHATQRDWQIGYSYKNGQFRCEKGELFGLDTAGEKHPIRSPNPKLYCGAGNCLIGLVSDRETMALAWMHTGGAHQFLGYVVSTWYGYGGHGVNQLFLGQPGRFSFAEAFHLNNQALVHRLQSRYPKVAALEMEEWGIERDPGLLNRFAKEHRIPDRDALGLLWDRDTVAFYGDPAWEARLEPAAEPAWDQTLVEKEGRFRFEIVMRRESTFARPAMALLPYRVEGVEVLAGGELKPLITDDFVLVPIEGRRPAGETLVVEFFARRHS